MNGWKIAFALFFAALGLAGSLIIALAVDSVRAAWFLGFASAVLVGAWDRAITKRLTASGTSGSAQDRNGLDPKGAGPTAEGGDAQ